MSKISKNSSITEGVIWKQILIFFFPILIGTFFQQMYNTVDALIIGQYVGTSALAAIGTTSTLVNMLINFFVGVASGATVIISQYFGAGDNSNVSAAVHTSIAFGIVSGIAITVFGLLTTSPSLAMLQVPQDIYEDSKVYLEIYYLGMIPSMIYNIGTGILRAVGDSKTPLYILIVSCFVNIILDFLLIAVIPMGVTGAAIATIISQAVSAVLVVLRLMRPGTSYSLKLKKIKFNKQIMKSVLNIGMPTGIQSILYSLSNLLVQSTVNSFGTNTIAAWTIYGKIDGIIWMIMGSFGISITTFVGQNYGAEKYDRIKKGVKTTLLLCVGGILLLGTLIMLLITPLFSIFTDESAVIEIGKIMVYNMIPFYAVFCFVEIYSGAIRGVGEAFQSTIITFLAVCVLRIVWILVAVPIFGSIRSLVVSYPITWTIASICFIIYYHRGNWLRRAKKRKENINKAIDNA